MRGSVAVTGAAAVTLLGSPPELWARYRHARAGSLSGPIETMPLDGLPEPVRARALRAERITQLALVAAGSALAAAGLAAVDGPPRAWLGVVLGTALGCFLTNAEYQRRLAEGGASAANPRLFAATVSNAAAGEVGIAYRLGGPSVTLSAGGASGVAALGHAVDLLRAERADALVAGGLDAYGEPVVEWMAAGGLDSGRPLAEAAGILVLETVRSARPRGVPVLATIAGYGVGFEPGSASGDGLAAAVASAVAEAGMSASEIEVVVSGAPPLLAPVEERALERTLGGAAPRRVAPKDVLGETLGAAGPLGLLAALVEAAPGAGVLVLDVCASGHVGALVARAGGAR